MDFTLSAVKHRDYNGTTGRAAASPPSALRLGFRPADHPWPKCDGRQSESLGVGQVLLQETTTGICVMDNCTRIVDRVRPMASLTIVLILIVAWAGALEYGLLRLIW
jgi:hypothetical protein